ncbi:TetR/AcrR family transcriptional regulator [Saccharothrix sp. ALI-22-I]|uniref:TetR/AcrR family transcriptional regulator n=1 Tax=Saccharothrix sp. ALI-22-I TaxID=1933778 RepID=UPI001EE6FA8F|nr:TetR/AcrR family transcriptional regulator [Saccharothrix sp. ALI-22-I]
MDNVTVLCNLVEVSPRRSDPRARTALIDIAARLLAAEGPQALSTRRIAADAGSSTMAVYTHTSAGCPDSCGRWCTRASSGSSAT